MKTLSFLASIALALVLLAPHAALANDLEESCELAGATNGTYLCGTALEFGWQAAHLREVLMSRHYGATADAGGATVSTQGAPSPYTGVFSLGAQRTGGSFSGDTQSLVLGVDRATAGGFLLGAMVQAGQSSLTTPAAVTIRRREVLVGPYMATELGNGLFLDAYLLWGRPDYSLPVASTGETLMGAATLSKSVKGERLDYVLYASLSAKRERPTATDRVDATILTLGSSLRFQDRRIDAGWRQNYARLELDFGQYRDNLGTGTIRYVAPRVALGTDIAFDNGGSLNLSVNASMASDQTHIVGIQAQYRIRF